MELVLDRYGMFLGKKSERVIIREKNQVTGEYPFFNVEQITIASSGISISTDVIADCMEHGIPIHLLNFRGEPYAVISSPHLTATVQTRRQQLAAYNDQRGVTLAKLLIEGKIRNQENTLKYFAKSCKVNRREIHDLIQDGAQKMAEIRGELEKLQAPVIDDLRGNLLSTEGRAANIYWELVGQLLQGKVDFSGREHRGATDPVNSLLNYGYGILYGKVWNALILSGLEPYGGFLHVDRPGKASLVLDFIEEFRSAVVDRSIIAMLSKGFTPKQDDEGRLVEETRRAVADKINERLDSTEAYEGKKHKLRTIMQMQARHMATFLRNEGKYKPFVAGW